MTIAGWTAFLLAASTTVWIIDRTRTIVVTGRPLAGTARALAECIVRHCPPDEEIDRTLAHMENPFIAGRYQEA